MLLDWITLTFLCICMPYLCIAFLCLVSFQMELLITLATWSYFLQMQASGLKNVILGFHITWGHSVCFDTYMGPDFWAKIYKNSHTSKGDICGTQIFQQKQFECHIHPLFFSPLSSLWSRPLYVISEHALRLDSIK
jgi:hypothetical protein